MRRGRRSLVVALTLATFLAANGAPLARAARPCLGTPCSPAAARPDDPETSSKPSCSRCKHCRNKSSTETSTPTAARPAPQRSDSPDDEGSPCPCCPCPGGCALCSVAKVPCHVAAVPLTGPVPCLGDRLIEPPSLYSPPPPGTLIRPPRA